MGMFWASLKEFGDNPFHISSFGVGRGNDKLDSGEYYYFGSDEIWYQVGRHFNDPNKEWLGTCLL